DLGVREQLPQKIGHRDFGCGAPVDRLADGSERLGEHRGRMMGRHVARPKVNVRRALVIAIDEAVQNFGEEPALLHAKPAHDAEIDRDDTATLVHEQVALMHVRVKQAVAHGVAKKRPQHDLPEPAEIVTSRLQGYAVRYWNPVDPLDGQNAPGRAPPVDLRHTEVLVVGTVLGHLRHRGSFEPQVHLELCGAGQRIDDRNGSQSARGRMETLDEPGSEIEAVEIAAEPPLDAGAKNLHRDLPWYAVLDDHCLVHLGDGGGSYGRSKLGEMTFELTSERLLDGAARFLHRERRQAVLEMAEVGSQLRSNDVGAGGQELP